MWKPSKNEPKRVTRTPRWVSVAAAAVALAGAIWGAFAWSYGASTPCRANLAAIEVYMRGELARGLATAGMRREAGPAEAAVMADLMQDARARVSSMSQLECWDDLRNSEWGGRG